MLPLESSVLMCFAKNLLEGKISAGSSKKRQSTDTAVRYVVPQSTSCMTRMSWHHPMRLSQVRGCSQEKTPDFFCTNVVLQNHQCRTGRSRSSAHRIVGHAVVPQDLTLVFLGQRQSEEMINSFGISRIHVWIVRGKNQIAAADLLDDVAGDDLVGFDGHAALPFEIITGLLL